VTGYTANPSSGQVTVAGAAQSVPITFTTSGGLGGPAYAVTWAQTGLPSKDLWMVGCEITAENLLIFGAQNTGASTEFAIPDGTYAWYVSTSVPGYVASPAYGSVTVAGAPVTIPIEFLRTYAVNFTESGLSSGAEWNVSLGSNYSSAFAPDNNTVMVTNGTYSFAAAAFGYTASPATGTITVNGASVSKAITFTALPTYDVTFTESGLPSGTDWQVTLNGSTQFAIAPDDIVFNLPNGDYPFDVSVTGYYSANPASGTITVAGAAQTKAISFTALPTYTVTFTETGLPSGTVWAVLLNGSYNFTLAPGDIGFQAPTGQQPFFVYAAGYTANPASGNVIVTTSGATVPVTFTVPAHAGVYNVTFTETGLPSTDWQVTLMSDQPILSPDFYCFNSTSSSTTLVCSVANGYYTWIVQTSVSDYTANPMAGAVTVSGHDTTVDVTFQNTASDYLVWFDAQTSSYFTGGLPNGTSWSVTLNGHTQTTEGTALAFLVPTGTTAAYTIAPPAGYVVLPSAGNLTGYASASQSTDYETVSPGVILAFARSSGVARSASMSGSTPTAAFYASLVVAFRDL
jgi:hypothetical protein